MITFVVAAPLGALRPSLFCDGVSHTKKSRFLIGKSLVVKMQLKNPFSAGAGAMSEVPVQDGGCW